MIQLTPQSRIFLATEPVDFRNLSKPLGHLAQPLTL